MLLKQWLRGVVEIWEKQQSFFYFKGIFIFYDFQDFAKQPPLPLLFNKYSQCINKVNISFYIKN